MVAPITNVISSSTYGLGNVIISIGNPITGILSSSTYGVTNIISSLTNILNSLVAPVTNVISGSTYGLRDVIVSIGNPIAGILSGSTYGVTNIIGSPTDVLNSLVTPIANVISGSTYGLGNVVVSVSRKVPNIFCSLTGPILCRIVSSGSSIAYVLSGLIGPVTNTSEYIISSFLAGFGTTRNITSNSRVSIRNIATTAGINHGI